MNDVKKLPKWAQDEIQVLKMRLQEMEKRARAYEEGRQTRVSIHHLRLSADEKPLYLPDDRQIRFRLGDEDWNYIDVRIRKYPEGIAAELMAGADIHIAPEVRNVSRIFVK